MLSIIHQRTHVDHSRWRVPSDSCIISQMVLNLMNLRTYRVVSFSSIASSSMRGRNVTRRLLNIVFLIYGSWCLQADGLSFCFVKNTRYICQVVCKDNTKWRNFIPYKMLTKGRMWNEQGGTGCVKDEQSRLIWHGEVLYTMVDGGEKTIAVRWDRRPRTAKQVGVKIISKRFLWTHGTKNVMSAQILEMSLFWSRDGVPSRKGCVVNGKMTEGKQQMSTPPPHPPAACHRRKTSYIGQTTIYIIYGRLHIFSVMKCCTITQRC